LAYSYSGDGGSGSSTNIDRQSLISALQKYGGIKSTIQELNQQVDELQRQKKDLYGQNQKMLSILANSKPIVEFLHGSADSLSDDDNIKILAMIAFILYILYIRYIGIEKLRDGGLEEFIPLSRSAAAAGGSETISVPKLKMAVAKALTILIAKLDTKSQINEDTTIDQDTTSLINNQQNKQ
jgi:hypothetical protein